MDEQEIKQQSQAYCHALYQQWKMLDFRGIMHINMDSHLNIALEDIFVVPDVLPIIPDFETLERDEAEAPRTTTLRPALKHRNKPSYQEKKPVERRDFLSVLATPQNHHLVILGDPGAGKTTLLRYLLLQLINRILEKPSTPQAITSLKKAFLPLYIPLAAYASAFYTRQNYTLDDFLPVLLKDYALDPYIKLLQTQIENKQVLFLFDGLDELANTELRRKIVDQLTHFTRVHAENYFLVTSRIVGYKDTQLGPPYKAYTIADFTAEQIKAFIQKWYLAYEHRINQIEDESSSYLRKRTEEEAERLYQTIQCNHGVQRLAANPLLLTILALIQRQGIDLPAHRVELFDLCVNTLIDTWLRAKGYLESSRLNKNDLIKLLRPLAFWMHDKLDASTVPEEKLREKIHDQIKARNPRANEAQITQMVQHFLDTVRGKTGILIERGEERYGFLHQTFQEYFAARELVVHRQRDNLIRQHLHDPHWREVILLAVDTIGILHNDDEGVTDLIQQVILKARSPHERWLHRDLQVCGFCLADDIGVSKECEDIILNEILHLYLTTPFKLLRQQCERVFLRWHNTEIAQEAQKLIVPFLNQQVRMASTDEQEDMTLSGKTAFEHRILSHYYRLIRQHAYALEQIVRLQLQVILRRLGRIKDKDIQVDDIALRYDVSWQIRKLTISLLLELGSNHSDLTNVLLTALNDPHPEVRRTAAKVLKERELPTPTVFTALRNARHDPDPEVRAAVIDTLHFWQPENEDGSATTEASSIPYEHTAWHEKNWHPDDEWLELEVPKAMTRREAVRRQASAKIDEAQIFNELDSIASSTEASNIRLAVTKMLKKLKHPPSPPSTPLETLQTLAEADPDPSVRELAIIFLRQLGNRQSPLLEILHDLMWCDPDPYVRETATIILGQSGNVRVIESLQKLAHDDSDPHVREAAVTALNQSDNMQQDNLGSLLPLLAAVETNPDTKTTMAAIEQLGKHHPETVQQLLDIVFDEGRIKELVHEPTEVYRRQLYIEALIRNLQILEFLGSDLQEVIELLFANLTSPNEVIRRVTVATLGKLGATNRQVVQVLIAMLSDRAEAVRNEAVNVLGKLGKMHHHVLEALVTALQEENAQLEKNALADKRAIAEALRRSECTKPFVIDALLSLLARSTPSSSEELFETMLVSHYADRQAVIETLAALGAGNDKVLHDKILQALLHTLKDPDLTVRATAVSALGHLGQGDGSVCRAVLETLDDKSPSVRQAAASALGKICWKTPDIIAALLNARQDSDLHVRKAAIPALIQLGSDQKDVQRALEQDLTHGPTKVRREVALAFAQLQQVDAIFIPMLLQALHDDNSSVRGNIALALGKIGGNPHEKSHVCQALIKSFQTTSSSTLRSDILLSLGKISDNDITRKHTHPVLRKALTDRDSSVRYNAALALARQESDDPKVVSVLLDSLLDTEAPYRQEAISLLAHARHKQPAIKDALLRSLADTDQAIREAAASALAVIGEDEARSATGNDLVQRLNHYKKLLERQLSADPTIEATFCALQNVMGDT